MDAILEKYEKLGCLKKFILINMTWVDIEWYDKFEGGKPERNKLIYHLKKNGFKFQNSFYIKLN